MPPKKQQATCFGQMFDEMQNEKTYQRESIKFEFAREIDMALFSKGMSRNTLAQRLGKPRSYITKIMRGDDNFTLETMINIAAVLGMRISLSLVGPCNETERNRKLSTYLLKVGSR